MRTRIRVAARLTAVAFGLAALPAAAYVEIDWVQIGSPGNGCDTQSQGCFGAVADPYWIGKYEVTNAQYAEFLNAVAAADPNGLYDTAMAGATGGIDRNGSAGSYTYTAVAGRENKPVSSVAWFDAVRFVNWLANGQPTGAQGAGTTETGTYTLTGLISISGGRAPDADVFLPTEDEWYKAAYFDPGLGVYYDYPAGTDTQTVCATPAPAGNQANCDDVEGNKTDVGAYTGSASPVGSFDQGGNVVEWSETAIGSGRGLRGGGYGDDPDLLAASNRFNLHPALGGIAIGFRVASAAGPPECGDGIDNDGDGRTDYGADCATADCGCVSPGDFSERDETGTYPCDDGLDNDGRSDGIDFDPVTAADAAGGYQAGSGDPGCGSPTWTTEEPKCQNGSNDDQAPGIDFDGGVSIWGALVDLPDQHCGVPWRGKEGADCGIGFELALLLPGSIWLRRRNRFA